MNNKAAKKGQSKSVYDVIGIMSGTSLDGLDVAYVRFMKEGSWSFELIESESFAFDETMAGRLRDSVRLNALELKQLDNDFGRWTGTIARKFIRKNNLKPMLIVSHGHTVFHQPERGITWQIGDGYRIMNETGVTTICDLRSLDVSLGGQGAPLVPVGDRLLFGEYDFCLNLGGFSNISFEKDGMRIAFDISPVNTVLNRLSLRLGHPYDKNGILAQSGRLDSALLQKLNALDYYRQPPPKSLGIEWANEHVMPLLAGEDVPGLLHTFCHHIAEQIVNVTQKWSFSHGTPTMLVTGGGAKNLFLMDLLEKKSNGRLKIAVPDEKLVDFKEAIIFAFLGLLRYCGENNCLSSVTGAARDSSGGLIYDHHHRARGPL